MSPTLCPKRYTVTIGIPYPIGLSSLSMFSGLAYWAPRYWRKRNVSVSSHVFCSSMRTRRMLPSASFTLAPKSIRNMDILSLRPLVYSCFLTSASRTSFLRSADRSVFTIRSSSIKYLKTMSYIGFAICIMLHPFLVTLKVGSINSRRK